MKNIYNLPEKIKVGSLKFDDQLNNTSCDFYESMNNLIYIEMYLYKFEKEEDFDSSLYDYNFLNNESHRIDINEGYVCFYTTLENIRDQKINEILK